MKTIITLSSAIALAISAHASFAGSDNDMGFGPKAKEGNWSARQQARTERRVEKMMARFDTNKDGQITLDEVQAVRQARFQKMDTDGNGGVSLEEFKAFKSQKRRPPRRSQADERGSQNQGMGSPNAQDEDGERRGNRPGGPNRQDQNNGWMGKGKRDFGPKGQCNKSYKKGKRLKARFNRLDQDNNGQISLEEFSAKVPLFRKFDTNHDGVITKAELSQKPQKTNRR